MSHYGTTSDYCTGYDDGADETKELYDDLVAAVRGLLDRWGNGNLTQVMQALKAALDALPEGGRMELDETTYPPGYERPDEDDEDDAYDDDGNLRAGDN